MSMERLRKLEQQRARAEQKAADLRRKEAQIRRKADTRRKIILGALVLSEAQRNPKVSAWLGRLVLARAGDRDKDLLRDFGG